MSDLNALVDAVLRQPLAGARAHAAAGGRVVGIVGTDIAVEIVMAAGAMPLQLPVLSDHPTPLADRYLEAGFSPAARSIAEQWLSGGFDFMQAVVFSRSDDSAQRLYYYLCELQRTGRTGGPRPLLYDVAKIPRPTSIRHTEESTRRLGLELGCNVEALPQAIEARNRRRRLLEKLALLRESEDAPSGPEVERLSRALDLAAEPARTSAPGPAPDLATVVAAEAAQGSEPGQAPDLAFDTALSAWLEAARPSHSGPRLILAGSVPPDERLHSAVEAAHGRIVDEVGDHSIARFGAPIAFDGATVRANDATAVGAAAIRSLAEHYHALPCGSRGFENRADRLVERALACRAHGVILWLIEEDEALVWDVPVMQRRLSAAGLPVLTLARRRWDLRDDALDLVGDFTARLRQAP